MYDMLFLFLVLVKFLVLIVIILFDLIKFLKEDGIEVLLIGRIKFVVEFLLVILSLVNDRLLGV